MRTLGKYCKMHCCRLRAARAHLPGASSSCFGLQNSSVHSRVALPRYFVLLVALALFQGSVRAATVNVTEPFNTAASSANDGWLGMGNAADGNNYGWSGTTFAG